ncbi:MAG: hypothetical protein ACRDEA_08905 [Microcystaceae cyanobacterium]
MSPIPPVRIYTLISYHQHILLVFYEPKGYQFRIVNSQGEVFGQSDIFYSEEATQQEGRKVLIAACNKEMFG